MCRKNKEELLVPKNFYDILSLLESGYIYDISKQEYKFNTRRATLKVEWTQLKEPIIDVSEQLIEAAHKNGFSFIGA